MSKNTRKHQRYSYIASAAIRAKDDVEGEPITVVVHNISEGGIGFFMEDPFELDAAVSVEFHFITKVGTETKDVIDGRVKSVSAHDKLSLVGVAFDENLNPKKQPDLYELFEQSIKSHKEHN